MRISEHRYLAKYRCLVTVARSSGVPPNPETRRKAILLTRSFSPTIRLRVAVLTCAVASAFAAGMGTGAPQSIAGLRAQVEQIQAQVAQIDAQVEAAAEAYNGAVYRLDQIQARIAANQRTLDRARKNLARAQELLAERLRAAYMRPPPSRMQIILQSGSVSSVIAGAEALNRASERDAAVVRSVKTLRDQAIALRKELVKDRAAAQDEVASRGRERDRVAGLLAQRQAVLSSAKGRLGRALAAERERQRRAVEAQRRAVAASRIQVGPDAGTTGGAPTAGGGATVSGSGSARNAQAARVALQYLGVPYVWGGASPSGFDCSGLAAYAYGKVGVYVPHYTGAIWAKFPRVTGPLQPGDLVFFHGLGHMGIYIGGGNFVHAPHTGDVVRIASLASRSNYVGAVRP